MGLLIDSTVLIHAERRSQTPEELILALERRFGDVNLAMSVMSAGELFHGCWRADTPAKRARREDFVEAILSAIPVVPVSLPIMRIYGELDAKLCAEGRKLPAADLIIASTALFRGDEVVTANSRHFHLVPGLAVKRLPA